MNLVLYGGGDDKDTKFIDYELLSLASSSPSITYIPSSSYNSPAYFRRFVTRFKRFGVGKFFHFPVDHPFSNALLDQAFKSDIIYLCGGNTYYFLYHLRKSKILKKLIKYVKDGGVLAGLSAGAIIMTPNINLAGIPTFDCDDNDLNLTNFKALGLTDFEFFPHYKSSNRYAEVLIKYSRSNYSPIFACKDGGGIIIEDDMISFVKATEFYKGNKISLI